MATKEKASDAFTAEEKAAMREHIKAEKAAARKAAKGETDLEPEVLAKIAELPEPDRPSPSGIHKVVKDNRAEPDAEAVLRDASVREGRQGPVLLPAGEPSSRRATGRSA